MPPHFATKPLAFWLPLLIALAAMLLFFTPMAHAQTPDTKVLKLETSTWKKLLDELDADIKKSPLNDKLLSQINVKLEKTSSAIKKFINKNKPFALDAKTLLDKLGKAPKDGEPAESEDIKKQRKELLERYTQTDGSIRSATSLGERSDQIRENVHDLRRNLFTSQILEKGKSPFSLSLWQEGVPGLTRAINQMGLSSH